MYLMGQLKNFFKLEIHKFLQVREAKEVGQEEGNKHYSGCRKYNHWRITNANYMCLRFFNFYSCF